MSKPFFTQLIVFVPAFFVWIHLGTFLPPSASADETSKDEQVQVLDPVVVSATKTPVPVSHLTSSVEVFTKEDFQERKVRTVVDMLRLSQGTAVFSTGGPGTSSNVRIRGGNARQTLVLVDGAIVNSATLGEFNFANLTVDNLEKVEILRGAQSMMWGSDAIGGVINIMTERGIGPPKVDAFFEYGSFNTVREGGRVSGDMGAYDFSMALSRWDSTSLSAVNFRRGASERDSYRNWTASSRIGVNLPKNGRFDFNFRWWNGDTDIDNEFGPSDVLKARSRSRQFIVTGIYEQPLTDWWTSMLTLSKAREKSLFDPGTEQRNLSTGVVSTPFGGSEETRVISNRIESQHNFQLGEALTLSMGYQFREQQGKNASGLSNKIVSSHSGFAQIQLNLFDRLLATAGVRQDSYNTFGDATTWRATWGYLLKEVNTKLRGSYATGFRAPSVNELFFPNFGNPNLEPEKSQSFDVGFDHFLWGKRIKLSGVYFWNRYRNLIETIQSASICGTGPFGVNFCPVNVSTAKSQGWEFAITSSLIKDLPFIKRLDLHGQYTMTLTRNLETGTRLARWPVDQASVRVLYQPIDPLNFIVDFRFVGSQFNTPSIAQDNSQRVAGFKVVNLTVNYDITKHIQAYTRVENLFDEEYEEVLFFGTPVRSIYGGLRVNFEVPLGSGSL